MEPLSKTWHMSIENRKHVFSKQHLDIISRLKLTDTEDFRFRSIENLNKNYYGDGKLYQVINKNDRTDFAIDTVIEIHGDLVSVATTPIEKHGIGYQIKSDRKEYPIAWDGSRWIFEPKNSPYLHDNLDKFITSDMYVKDVIPSSLSAPDNYGLRRNVAEEYFIKHNDNYLKLEIEEGNAYYLVTEKYRIPLKNEGGKFSIDVEPEQLLRYEKMLPGADEKIYHFVTKSRNSRGRRYYSLSPDLTGQPGPIPVQWDAEYNLFVWTKGKLHDEIFFNMGPSEVTDQIRTATAKALGINI